MAPFGSEEAKEICWEITKFKGMFEMVKQKPAVNFSISWEMWCECLSEGYRGDNFDLARGSKPPCSEFTGKFQERTFSCDPGEHIEGKFGIGPDCCTESKCALTEKEISFDKLMPIPFELLTPADGHSEYACDQGWENDGDYDAWGGDPDSALHGGADIPLTPRAQALREFGCSRLGSQAERTCGNAVLRNGGESGTRSGGVPDPGEGKWNYTKVKTEKERDEILRLGLLCSDAATLDDTGGSGEKQKNRAEAILKLCFVLGGAYDTDNDDQPEEDNASNGGSQNDGLKKKGWVEKEKPKFNCETCECKPRSPLFEGDPRTECTDPPCEEPQAWWTN